MTDSKYRKSSAFSRICCVEGPAAGCIEPLESRRLFAVTSIAWNTVNQVINGFGASSAWTTQSVTTSQQQLLFSPTDGAGLSILRSRINADTNATTPASPTSWEIQTMQKAVAMGVTVWSTPWSPPQAWKSNGSVNNGGSLLPSHYQDYANWLAQYVVNMKNSGIPLYAISLQNEPDQNVSYESCIWTADQFASFLPDVVTAFANYNVSGTKIIMPEDSGWHWDLATTVMNTPALNASVAIYANHDYDHGKGTVPGAAGKQLWMTENYDTNAADTGIASGLWVAQNVYDMIVTSGVNAYHYWWIHSGGNYGNGVLLGGDWQQTSLFWGLANYSKFIRPGWNNIGQTNDGGLTTSAYKNTATGDFATVLVNSGTSPITETINLGGAYAPVLTPWVTSATLNLQQQTPIPATGNGGSFTYTIPAQSIVTLTGTATTTPVTAAPPGLTVTPTGPASMSLAWTSNVASATGYTVQRSTDNSNWSTLTNTLSGSTFTYTDSALSANTLYYYRVIANNGSVYSNVSYDLTLPNPVTNLASTYSSSTFNVTLNWTASTTPGVDYEVLRSKDGGVTWSQLRADIAGGNNSYTDTTAPEVTALQYQVLAISGANASAVAQTTIFTTAVRAPTLLTAIGGAVPGSVTLSWINNSNQPATTYIERSSNEGTTWTVVASVSSGVATYTDSPPGAGNFQYRVRANYNAVYSAYAPAASFTVSVLTLSGGAGANTFYLKDSGANLNIWINSATPGSGTPTQTAALSSFTSVSINGGSVNDSLTLDYSGGDPTGVSITFNSSTGSDTLTIKGETGGVLSTLSSSSITIGSDLISYTALEQLNLDLGTGAGTLTASSPGVSPQLNLTIGVGTTLALGASSTLAANTTVNLSGTLNLTGQNESIDQLIGVGTVNSSGGTLSVGSYNGSSSFGGTLTGFLSLDKVGTGSFTLTGNSNYSGSTTVNSGLLSFMPATGSDNLGATTSSIFIAPGNTDNATLVIAPNVNFVAGGTYGGVFLACNSVSNNGGGIGVLNQTGGSITVASGVFYMAGANTVANGANATWNFSGGIDNLSASLTMSINNNSVSSLNVSGTAQLNMWNNTGISLGNYYTRPATITQTGGAITFYGNAGTAIGGTGSLDLNHGGGSYLYSLAGGTLTVPSIITSSATGSAAINFSGGTLVAAASSTNFISTAVTTRVRSAGANINTNGKAITIARSLIHDSSLGVSADGGLSVTGAGSLTLSATSTYTGPTNVSGSTLVLASSASIATSPTINVNAGGVFNLAASTGTGILVRTLGNLIINPGGAVTIATAPTQANRQLVVAHGLAMSSTAGIYNALLDLTNNDLDIQLASNAGLASFSEATGQGFNATGAGWQGASGITSSTAAADPTHLGAVGVILNSTTGASGGSALYGSATAMGSFDGVSPSATDVLMKYTYFGDADLNGKVDGSDYSRIDASAHSSITGWFNGDFNYAGNIDGSDYTLMDNAYNTQGASRAARIATSIHTGSHIDVAAVNPPIELHKKKPRAFSTGPTLTLSLLE